MAPNVGPKEKSQSSSRDKMPRRKGQTKKQKTANTSNTSKGSHLTNTPPDTVQQDKEDYILSVNAIRTGAIPKYTQDHRRKSLRDELLEVEDGARALALEGSSPMRNRNLQRQNIMEADREKTSEELLAEFATLRKECENMRLEFTTLNINIADVENRVENMQEGMEEMEVKLRFEVNDQLRSFRDCNENRLKYLNDRWTQAMSDTAETNQKTVTLCEELAS